MPATLRVSEELTRKEMIDPQLEKAGWYTRDHSRVRIEIPVDGYDAEPWNGVSDYCLYRENGELLAFVEANIKYVMIMHISSLSRSGCLWAIGIFEVK